MKKLSILFVAVLALGISFVSCSKDDDNETSGSIEGKWNHSKVQSTIDGKVLPETDYENEPGCNKDFLELKTDGVSKSGFYEGKDCTLDLDVSTWKKDGNKLTIVGDEVYEIVSVTNTTLKLKWDYKESGVVYSMVFTLLRA
jgi:hypothetical protein